MFKKFIVSHLGDLTRDSRIAGDIVRYKIYFTNTARKTIDIVITDKLDKNLSQVKVYDGGQYDHQNHSVSWTLKNIARGKGETVEFEARIGKCKEILNQAVAQSIDKRKSFKSNAVIIVVFDPPKLGWIPFDTKSKEREPPTSNMKDESTTGTTVNFDIPGMFVNETKINGITYHRISIPGHARLMTLGKPELPIVGQVIEIPHDVSIEAVIVKYKSTKLEGYNVYPAQEPLPHGELPSKRRFVIDKAAYLARVKFPAKLVAVHAEDIGIIRGHRVIFLKVNPLQVNPVTREARAFSNIEVRIEYSHPAQVLRVSKRIESKAFEDMLQRLVLNYKPRDRFPGGEVGREGESERWGKESGGTAGCDYLILTHASFYNATDANNPVVRFRNWKRRKGFVTTVIDVATIPGGNTAANIRSYIQNAYDNWDPAPTYVLLIGDADFVPTNYGMDHPSSRHYDSHGNPTKIGTDLYYALVDGTDYFPDIFLGRLSVENMAEATTVIDKIIKYEQDPPATPANANYYVNTPVVSLFEDTETPISNGTEDPSFRIVEFSEAIRTYLIGQNYNVDRVYSQSGNAPQGPSRYEDGTAIPVDLTLNGNPPAGIPGFPWNGGAVNIQNSINGGAFLVTYDGHGNRAGWSRPAFDKGGVNGLANGVLTPVVFSFACQTGWFDNETDHPDLNTQNNDESFCEVFQRRANGGTVAIVGSTRNSFENNDFMMLGAYKAIWPDFNPNPPTSLPLPQMQMGPLYSMGQILTFCKTYMANVYGHDVYRQASFEMYHLFGDPEMPVLTRAPAVLHVIHPAGIGSSGEQDFVVRVTDADTGNPVQSAAVTLTHKEVVGGVTTDRIVGAMLTNPDGIARYTLQGIATGSLDITVTSHNYRPYTGTITVSNNGAFLNRLQDDNGVEGQTVHVGGQGFLGGEKVDIYFDEQLSTNATAAPDGSFGQVGSDVDIQVPAPYAHRPVNVSLHGQTSGRYAVDVFQVRDKNPVDLYTYSQWDRSTWFLHPGDNPTWDNPEIQLYDGGTLVDSNNLVSGKTYTVKFKIHNDTPFKANGAKVIFRWADFGIGGPFSDFYTDTRDVSATSVVEAQAPFTPHGTGHLCILGEIYHMEDIKPSNNCGQENLHVGPTSSPVEICFRIWNPTEVPAAVHLEVRQLIPPGQESKVQLWATWIKHPNPQVLKPGDSARACVKIDPDFVALDNSWAWRDKAVKPGTSAEFAVTGFIGNKMIGGINLTITKK
jgi:hypothetical protein